MVTSSFPEPSPPIVVNDHGDLHIVDSIDNPGVESFDAMDFEYFDASGRKMRPLIDGYRVSLELDPSANPEPDHLRELIHAYVEEAMQRRDARPSDRGPAEDVLHSSDLADSIVTLRRFIEVRQSRGLLGRIASRKKRTEESP